MTSDKSTVTQVTVLMSSYNGGQFLQQQLNSLYAQTYSNIKIVVRDDGSQDGTRLLLAAEAERAAIILLPNGTNLGATGSFFALLRHAAQTDTAYVAFCDQDDVWYPDKIARAVSSLADFSDYPALYCSRLAIVDAQLQPLSFTAIPRKIGFGNALVENIAVGCTMLLNRHAIDLLCQQRLPDEVYVHDWWCYLVISCFGKVIFDEQPSIHYRQHGGNVIGAASSKLGVLKRKVARFFNGRLWISEQAEIFHALFSEKLPAEQQQTLVLLLKAKSSFFSRWQLALSGAVWRQKILDNLILRVVVLMNRI